MKITLLSAIIMLLIVTTACNKEEAITPSADFTTNITNNTLKKGQGFTLYLDGVDGEFLVYFKGNNEAATYNADDPTRLGTPISNGLDSLAIMGYTTSGEYVFTLVASSSGNWGEDYFQDVKSVTITVTD